MRDKRDNQRYQPGNHVVKIELALLKKLGKDDGSSVYLFGMHSSILLFAKGMFALCNSYSTDQALLNAIDQQAMRLFQYCCAIASDGTRRVDDEKLWPKGTEPNSIVLDRVLPKTTPDDDPHATDRLLQCFYPHRLTQFADLGKIFIIVCQIDFARNCRTDSECLQFAKR